MKKLLSIIMLLSIFLTSCEKDDLLGVTPLDEEETTEQVEMQGKTGIDHLVIYARGPEIEIDRIHAFSGGLSVILTSATIDYYVTQGNGPLYFHFTNLLSGQVYTFPRQRGYQLPKCNYYSVKVTTNSDPNASSYNSSGVHTAYVGCK